MMRRAAAGVPAMLRFREKWRIALAQVRAILQAGFTITGVAVDADYGGNAAFRAGLERLGLPYRMAIRGEALCEIVGVPGPHRDGHCVGGPRRRLGVGERGAPAPRGR
jgi:SRSO17 transposase